MLLYPRVPCDDTKLPMFETTPGRLDANGFADWLAHQHQHARIERNALRAARDAIITAASVRGAGQER